METIAIAALGFTALILTVSCVVMGCAVPYMLYQMYHQHKDLTEMKKVWDEFMTSVTPQQQRQEKR